MLFHAHNPRMDPHIPDGTYNSPEHRARERGRAPTPGNGRSTDPNGPLLRRMADGDEQALGLLYDRLAPMVTSLAGAILADPDDVEEVVEETFWQAWRNAAQYAEARGAVSTWIGVIARSRALDRLRRRRRVREESWEELPASAVGSESTPSPPSPLQYAAAAERRDQLAAALRELPPEQRQALELAYFHGMSQSEISAHTAQPLGTIKTRVRLAMRKLRERLSPLHDETP